MKYALLITILFLTGCYKEVKHYTVSYKDVECKSFEDVGVRWNGSGYECFGNYIIKSNNKRVIAKEKTAKKSKGCETIITEIFNSKEFKKPLTICKGRLLEDGEKTRIIRVNK